MTSHSHPEPGSNSYHTKTDDLPRGRYRHYKGNEYTVLDVVLHSETEEELVLYRQEYGDRALWVRPKAMFTETVCINGSVVPRFQFIDPTDVKSGIANLLRDIPATVPAEIVETILNRPNVRIERIISQGQASPADFWYDQDQSELVVLLQGAARLQFETHEVHLVPGAYVDIPAHQRHRVAWTSPNEPTIWLAVFY